MAWQITQFAGGYHLFDTDWEPVRWDETNATTALVWWGSGFTARLRWAYGQDDPVSARGRNLREHCGVNRSNRRE